MDLDTLAEASDLLTSAGITATYFQILHALSKKYRTMSEVATLVHSSTANTTELIRRMENLGYVERKHRTDDRRIVMVYLTPAGKDKLESVPFA